MPVLIILTMGGLSPASRLIFPAFHSHRVAPGLTGLPGPKATGLSARAPNASGLLRVGAPGHAGAPSSMLLLPPVLPAANVKLFQGEIKRRRAKGKGSSVHCRGKTESNAVSGDGEAELVLRTLGV